MKKKSKADAAIAILIRLVILIMATHSVPAWAQHKKVLLPEEDEKRISLYEKELEKYLANYLVNEYEERSSKLWKRDYSSIAAFERSVAKNRQRWEEVVIKPPVLSKTGALKRKPYNILGIEAEWLELPLGNLSAQAVIAFPPTASSGKPVPLVIALHGIESGPETAFENGPSYHAYARALLEAGFAVLAPLNMRSISRRNNIERFTRLADISLPGIELARLQHLLDVVLQDKRIDSEKVGAWGVSLGGMATMFWMPLEPRIKAGVVSAWFNHRVNKMVVPDESYGSFYPNEEYAFLTGWLTEFSDHDVMSLICPRPVQIQHGKNDRIAKWSQVVEEFEKSKLHYDRLNIADRIELKLHEGRHEALTREGVSFLKKWLQNDQ
ncbi:MAG: alpha/beta hydrolase family protein [Agriterribacter sp.]